MIKSYLRGIRGLTKPVMARIKALQLAFECDTQGAVVAMGIARLEGGYGCVSCGAFVGRDPQRPPAADSTRWPEIAEKHVQGCRWVATKGFQVVGA